MTTKRPVCANCGRANNGTDQLCSACYSGLGYRTWPQILADVAARAEATYEWRYDSPEGDDEDPYHLPF